jgi:hypothetical protein
MVGTDCHQCPPGMAEASSGGQSVSAHPEHGGLSPGWEVDSLYGRRAHWVAATQCHIIDYHMLSDFWNHVSGCTISMQNRQTSYCSFFWATFRLWLLLHS